MFRLLVRRYPDQVPAGEIGRALDLKPSTLSVYLSALTAAGLIVQHRKGTSLMYRADMGGAEDLIEYLFQGCCNSRPDLCLTRTGSQKSEKYNVLFICTGNSARSIFAEAILTTVAGDRFNVYSAGTKPASTLNPVAVKMLDAKGHDISNLRAKHIAEFQTETAPVMDFVFTVCDQAANEDCPAWTGQPITAHWGLPDPVKATGSEAERYLAFQQAYGILKNRLSLFTALRPETLERAVLQARVDEISLEGKSL
ncbi:transcriptional regulator, ArsR family [Roseovarius lutimaris]|uniref:Transcriptional regulator, ArsR family n=1 Tax=Roseovarius lutimaris TaxID=1005928 RepID=A0A1I5AMM5_9RHOB|nr:transcriptional regulator, ArsR family [Roseovarius lutimaris]